jgi:hypothetical protein
VAHAINDVAHANAIVSDRNNEVAHAINDVAHANAIVSTTLTARCQFAELQKPTKNRWGRKPNTASSAARVIRLRRRRIDMSRWT